MVVFFCAVVFGYFYLILILNWRLHWFAYEDPMPILSRWFDDIAIQKKLLLIFAVPLLLMVSVSVAVYQNTQSMVEDNHWVAHTHKAIARVQELLTLIVDMETGKRGFLITGTEEFSTVSPFPVVMARKDTDPFNTGE